MSSLIDILKHFKTSHDDSHEIKSQILDVGTVGTINSFELTIDNKYYSADIYLFDIKDKQLINKRFVDCVKELLFT